MARDKAKTVLLRYGFSDVVVTPEQSDDDNFRIRSSDSYFIGYEDEDSEECEEDGTYLDQKIDPNQLKADL